MIKRLLRSLRRQPKIVRNNVALGVAAVFTGLVSLVWLVGTPDRLAGTTVEHNPNLDEGPSFSQLFNGLKDQLAEVKDAVKSESEPEPERPTPGEVTFEGPFEQVRPASTPAQRATTASQVTTTQSATVIEAVPEEVAEEAAPEVAPRNIRIVATKTATSGAATTTRSQ